MERSLGFPVNYMGKPFRPGVSHFGCMTAEDLHAYTKIRKRVTVLQCLCSGIYMRRNYAVHHVGTNPKIKLQAYCLQHI